MAQHNLGNAIRGAFQSFEKGDHKAILDLCAEDAVWHGAPGNTMISGDFKGRDAIVKHLTTSAQATEGSMKFDVKDVLASDNHVVAIAKGTAKRKGHTIEGLSTFVFRIENGKVAEVWVHGDTSLPSVKSAAAGYTWEDFWSK